MSSYRRNPRALWRRTPYHVVTLLPGSGEPSVLSGEAVAVWDALDQQATVGDATDEGIPPSGLAALLAGRLVEPIRQTDARLHRPDAPESPRPGLERIPVPPGAALEHALTFWLPGGERQPEYVDRHGWASLLDRARVERCLGVLAWAVSTGEVMTTPEDASDAERHAVAAAQSAVELEAQLLEVASLLDEHGVDFRVLKGAAVAHLDYPDPSLRSSSDVDLLVGSDDLRKAAKLLVDAGYERDLPERRAGFDRFEKALTFQAPGRYEIDVHRTPLAGPIGERLNLGALWSLPDMLTVGGYELAALDPAGRFAHAAWSLLLTDDRLRLVPALDMAAIASTHGVAAERVLQISPAGQGGGVLAKAMETAEQLLAIRFEEPHLPPPTRLERMLAATYPGLGGTKAESLLAATLSMEGWRRRVHYISGLLVPSSAYRQARRDRGRPAEWQLAVTAIRRRVSSRT